MLTIIPNYSKFRAEFRIPEFGIRNRNSGPLSNEYDGALHHIPDQFSYFLAFRNSGIRNSGIRNSEFGIPEFRNSCHMLLLSTPPKHHPRVCVLRTLQEIVTISVFGNKIENSLGQVRHCYCRQRLHMVVLILGIYRLDVRPCKHCAIC